MQTTVIIALSLVFFIVLPVLWVLSYKYWFFSSKDFSSEIFMFLEEQDLQFLEARKIAETDFIFSSPYETRETRNFLSYLINTLYNHQFIKAKTKTGQKHFFWFRASARFFKSIEIEFKEANFNEQKIVAKSKVTQGNNCPACNRTVSKEDEFCSFCGLNFVQF